MELLKEAKDKRDTKINKIEKMKGIKNPLDLYKNLESLSSQELDDLSDEERLMAVGEGRGRNMQWLVLTPHS